LIEAALPIRGSSLHAAAFRRLEAPACRAKRLSWEATADAFGIMWDNLFRSVKHAVEWGLAHPELAGIEAIGVAEVQWHALKVLLKNGVSTDPATRVRRAAPASSPDPSPNR
jgi:hypothetical protein